MAENRQPGTTAWRITDQGPGSIDGFADLNYAAVGDTVHLYVSTTAPTFSVTAYRMGWYQGLGGPRDLGVGPIAGTVQPPCPVDPTTNMVSCDNWTPDVTMPVTPAFVPGDYLLKLVGSGNQQAYVLLTVWDPSSHATYLIMNRSLVEQGWNTFGGYSFYQGIGPCILDTDTYPVCNRARVVSFDRPYDGDGSSDFLTNEYPLVAYAEEHGLDVTYCTDICVSEHPGLRPPAQGAAGARPRRDLDRQRAAGGDRRVRRRGQRRLPGRGHDGPPRPAPAVRPRPRPRGGRLPRRGPRTPSTGRSTRWR